LCREPVSYVSGTMVAPEELKLSISWRSTFHRLYMKRTSCLDLVQVPLFKEDS
jgi:hypothetical protein